MNMLSRVSAPLHSWSLVIGWCPVVLSCCLLSVWTLQYRSVAVRPVLPVGCNDFSPLLATQTVRSAVSRGQRGQRKPQNTPSDWVTAVRSPSVTHRLKCISIRDTGWCELHFTEERPERGHTVARRDRNPFRSGLDSRTFFR